MVRGHEFFTRKSESYRVMERFLADSFLIEKCGTHKPEQFVEYSMECLLGS